MSGDKNGSSKNQRTNSESSTVPVIAASIQAHPAWFRLCEQLDWYNAKSGYCQTWYKRLKVTQVSLAVLIPVSSLLPAEYAKWAAALAGASIALLEAIQQINQYATLWVEYRAVAERLKYEKYLFLSAAGPYNGLSEAERLTCLAERAEEQISSEHSSWFNETRRAVVAREKEAS